MASLPVPVGSSAGPVTWGESPWLHKQAIINHDKGDQSLPVNLTAICTVKWSNRKVYW